MINNYLHDTLKKELEGKLNLDPGTRKYISFLYNIGNSNKTSSVQKAVWSPDSEVYGRLTSVSLSNYWASSHMFNNPLPSPKKKQEKVKKKKEEDI